jgi:hypothetical protein
MSIVYLQQRPTPDSHLRLLPMVAESGTSVSWSCPFFCAASIWTRTRDPRWLGKVYPLLERFLRWTLQSRIDGDGFVGKCSWETGMDTSSRFLIQQPTGGEVIEFLRIVELQAAKPQAAAILVQFAEALGDANSGDEWQKIRQLYAAKTQTLSKGWPGGSCEVWGSQGAYGGEGYGWGAVLPPRIIRNVFGFRDPQKPDEVPVSPNLPKSFRVSGKTNRIADLRTQEFIWNGFNAMAVVCRKVLGPQNPCSGRGASPSRRDIVWIIQDRRGQGCEGNQYCPSGRWFRMTIRRPGPPTLSCPHARGLRGLIRGRTTP